MADFTRLQSRTSEPAEADALLAASGGRFMFSSAPDAGFSFAVDQALDPSFSVGRFTVDGGCEASGDFDDIVIVNVTRGAYLWDIDGQRGVATRSPFLIRPGHDFTCFAEDADMVDIFLPPAMLQDVARTTYGDEDLTVVFDSAETTSPRHAAYMMTAATVAAEYMESGTFRHPLVRASLFHTLSLAALQCFPLSGDPRERPMSPAWQLETYRSAVRFIEDYASLPITVTDIAGAVGATMAQLNSAFRAHGGTSARTHLQNVRLSAARTDLLVSDPAGTDLADLAARWGFPDVDRFTRRYREHYGELPGASLVE